VTPDQSGEQTPQSGEPEPSPQNIFDKNDAFWWTGGKKVSSGEEFNPRKLDTPLDKMMRSYAGRRSVTRTERKRGRYIQSRPANGRTNDLAFDATLRAAAPFQRERKEIRERNKVAFAIRPNDYMKKIRVRKTANLILFLVDASWSMAVAERMAATKGAILSLLTDAYQRRDRVGLVVFQKNRATLILPPTNSVLLAQEALADVPVGGKTPLSAGLLMSFEVIKKEKLLHPEIMPLLIILTDGAGNVSIGRQSPQEEAFKFAEMIAQEKIHSVVINMEHAAFDQGLAQALADHLESPCYTITDLKAESLFVTVQQEIRQANANLPMDFK
jgi:magnesium chelatase subunit ChlD-like protein